MTPQEIIDVVTAFRDGKKIQHKDKRDRSLNHNWRICDVPNWDFYNNDYRVAPEPKVIWVHEFSDGSCLGDVSKYKSENRMYLNPIRRSVKYIEVIEG